MADSDALNPLLGDPDDPTRCRVDAFRWEDGRTVWLPGEMVRDPRFESLNDPLQYRRLRIRYDFEYWAFLVARIRYKYDGKIGPIRLNGPQRKLLRQFELQRLAGKPIRCILLKARQWGGSTLVQLYMAWIQIVLRRNWNSVFVGQNINTAATLLAMTRNVIGDYPLDLLDDEDSPDGKGLSLKTMTGSQSIREINGRGARIVLTSAHNADAARSQDLQMAHFSEVAFWPSGEILQPSDVVRNISSGIPMVPLSMIVMESTADGIGNFFHCQWNDAKLGLSSYVPVFVPWYEIGVYRQEVTDPQWLIDNMTPYEWKLWEMGLTLEKIQWYHFKRREVASDATMQSEFPTTPEEAFNNTGRSVFPIEKVEQMRADCREPLPEDAVEAVKENRGLLNQPSADGKLSVWKLPDRDGPRSKNRYVVGVDIGGRSSSSDYSVITVFDRFPGGPSANSRPEVVAQWRGHADHDLLGQYIARVGNAYLKAHVVVESNTLDTEAGGGSQYVLERLNREYQNVYRRRHLDEKDPTKYDERVGFHTNASTKPKIIAHMLSLVRDRGYLERDNLSVNEMLTFETRPNGTYAARDGSHDDLLMSRAMALYVISTLPPPCSLTYRDLSPFKISNF